MEIAFGESDLQRAYAEPRYALKLWNRAVAKKYLSTVQFIALAQSWEQVKTYPPFRTHQLNWDLRGLWSMKLTGRWRVLVELVDRETLAVMQEVSNHYDD